MRKRISAFIMAILLVLMAVPVPVFAEEAEITETEARPEEIEVEEVSEVKETAEELLAEEAAGNLRASSGRVDRIYSSMTPEERIAQMFLMQARSWKGQSAVTVLDNDLKDLYAQYRFGGFLFFAENMQDTLGILALSKDLQSAVISGGGVPMIIAAEQEGGSISCIPAGTPMPGNMAIAAAGDPSNARTAGRIISEELDALGVNCTFAPEIDLLRNPENPVLSARSFGDTAGDVAEYGAAFLAGIQNGNTISCVKYFAGCGDAEADPRTGCPVADRSWEELLSCELIPFQSAIGQNAGMIMAGQVIYPKVDGGKIIATKGVHKGEEVGIPATLSHTILTEKLRGELGFTGVICTDCMSTGRISSMLDTNDSVARAINAGADLICMPLSDEAICSPEAFRKNTDALIRYIKENVPAARIEEAVKRILMLKENQGILDYDESLYTEVRALETVGSAEFRQEEREMAACGVTLVKNDGNLLPLQIAPGSRVLMLVNEPYAAQFIMGWNRAREAGLIPSDVNVDVIPFDESDWGNDDKLQAIDNADYLFTDSAVRGKTGMAYETWQTAAPKKYTDYAKEKGKKSFVISLDAPYDVQLYPNADGIAAIYNPAGSRENWKEVLESGTTVSKYAMGANLVEAVEVSLGVYGASGTLPVNIYAFDAASGSFDESRIVYERGFGIRYDPITAMDKTEVSLEFSQAEYTGKEICPQVVVTIEEKRGGAVKVLTEGRDYSVTYENNVNVGTARTVLQGMGSYVGSISRAFEIVAKKTAGTTGGGTSLLFTGTWDRPVSNGVWNYHAASDTWTYTTGRKFTNTWGYIENPYASDSQHKCDWFYFDASGNMLTGWQWIKGSDGRERCYYLNPKKDNTLGACLTGPAVTPDGYTVDESGAWTVNGNEVLKD